MNNDVLNTILDVTPDAPKTAIEQAVDIIQAEIVPEPPTPAKPAVEPTIQPDPQMEALDQDMDLVRANMKELIEQGKIAITGVLELAEQGEQPRAYEVVATVISAIVQANRELINIHKVRKDSQKTDKETKQVGESQNSGQVVINKAIFVGKAQDLLRAMKDAEKEINAIHKQS